MATSDKRIKIMEEKRAKKAALMIQNKGESKYAKKLRFRKGQINGYPLPMMLGYSRPYGPMWLHRDQVEALNTPLARWDRPFIRKQNVSRLKRGMEGRYGSV